MSRSKLFNMIKSRGSSQNGRNSFDLSTVETLTENVATITPYKVIDTIPDDYFDFDIRSFTQQLSAMNTAAFVRGRKEIAAYFLPYNSIWSNYNQYQATREDPESALLQQQGISYEPRMALYSLYQYPYYSFLEFLWARYYMPIFDFRSWLQAYEQVHGDHAPIDVALDYFNSHRAVSEADYLRRDVTDTPFAYQVLQEAGALQSDPAFSFFDLDVQKGHRQLALNSVGDYAWCDILRKIDNLGLGNVYPYFNRVLAEVDSYYTKWQELASDGVISEDVFDEWWMRVWQPLFFGSDGSATTSLVKSISSHIYDISVSNVEGGVQHTYVNVYPLFAYNRCFYDFFRNSYFDLDYSSRNYNCDFLDCRTLAGSVLWPKDLPARFWQLEHHQFKKDMFTGVLPDVQFGVVSSLTLHSQIISDFSVSSGTRGAQVNSTGILFPQNSVPSSSNWSLPSAFNVMELKRAEALQQYRMDLMRAGNRTQDIFKQIYGTQPKSQLDSSPYFIEVAGSDLYVDPVVASASTGVEENGSLGDISARITVKAGSGFKFSTHDFGCIIILGYSVVDASYNSYRINPHRMNLTPEEHFIPQLMNLGFEPVTNEMLNSLGNDDFRRVIRGYVPPYTEFKTDVDSVHGNLVDLPVAVQTLREAEPLFDQGDYFAGSLSIWAVSRTRMQNQASSQLSQFYQSPSIMDNVFLVQHGFDYETDHFITHIAIGCKSVRQLTELGLPRFC